MIEFLLSLVAIQNPLLEQVREAPFLSGYLLCVVKKAGELEASGESAESIAVASVSACDRMVDPAVELSILQEEANLRQQGNEALTTFQRDKVKLTLRESLRKAGNDLAISRVVNMRAQR